MHRTLSPISENDHLTSSSEATPYEDLPMVTPKVRTLDETTQRQNAENAKLSKQLLAYQEKEDRLHERVQELEGLTAALVNPTGRNPTDKTANNTNETRTSTSAFTPQAAAGPATPRRCVPSCPKRTASNTHRGRKERPVTYPKRTTPRTASAALKERRKFNRRAQNRDRGSQVVF
jgi:hypothetical protein